MNKNISRRLQQGILAGVFSQAELLVSKNGLVVCHESVGDMSSRHDMFFDIASLTKPLCASLICMIFVQEGKVSLEKNVTEFFPTTQLKHVSLRSLLNHTSGLIGWYPFSRELCAQHARDFSANRDFILDKILNDSQLFKHQGRVLYSDLGYILLGAILEKTAAKRLDEIYRNLITSRLKIAESVFFQPRSERPTRHLTQLVPSEVCTLRKKEMRGEVMDETAWLMGGVAGHAGLFANSMAIQGLLCELQLARDGNLSLFKKSTFMEFCHPDPKRDDSKAHFTLGFDTPTLGQSQSGTLFSKNSIGHLGFSGTSFWWDLDRDFWIILLTNRCMPDRNNDKIREFRPALHDLIVELGVRQNKWG